MRESNVWNFQDVSFKEGSLSLLQHCFFSPFLLYPTVLNVDMAAYFFGQVDFRIYPTDDKKTS